MADPGALVAFLGVFSLRHAGRQGGCVAGGLGPSIDGVDAFCGRGVCAHVGMGVDVEFNLFQRQHKIVIVNIDGSWHGPL